MRPRFSASVPLTLLAASVLMAAAVSCSTKGAGNNSNVCLQTCEFDVDCPAGQVCSSDNCCSDIPDVSGDVPTDIPWFRTKGSSIRLNSPGFGTRGCLATSATPVHS